MHANLKVFDAVSKQQLFPLIRQISFKSSLRMFNLNCFITISNFILTRWKVFKKMKPVGFALCLSCDPKPRSRSMNWYMDNGHLAHQMDEHDWLQRCTSLIQTKTVFSLRNQALKWKRLSSQNVICLCLLVVTVAVASVTLLVRL